MNLRNVLCGIALAGVLAVSSEQVFPQEKGGGNDKAPPMQEEMMKRWAEAATPGSPHKLLDHFVGKWDVTARLWFEGPSKPPMESKGVSEVRWIMDGRFVQEDTSSQVMGMPYRNLGITGYDNLKRKYVTSYIDNMATGIYFSEGTLDESGKVLTQFGKMDEPMTGERDKLIKYVTRIIGPDKHVFEIYDLVGTPSEFKSVELVYVRKR